MLRLKVERRRWFVRGRIPHPPSILCELAPALFFRSCCFLDLIEVLLGDGFDFDFGPIGLDVLEAPPAGVGLGDYVVLGNADE
jgi:hypothetical protein